MPQPRKTTRNLLRTYVWSGLIYLSSQELLNVFIFAWNRGHPLKTFAFDSSLFMFPGVSAALLLSSYVLLSRVYRPRREHYLLHALTWVILLVPQLASSLGNELNIVYVAWSFVLATTAAGTVAFQDLCLIERGNEEAAASRFIHEELRFYLDKLSVAWLTLGTVLAVCMTILWTAPLTSFQMAFSERVFWAVYMVCCFGVVTVLIFIFVAYPILRSMRDTREVLLAAGRGGLSQLEVAVEPSVGGQLVAGKGAPGEGAEVVSVGEKGVGREVGEAVNVQVAGR